VKARLTKNGKSVQMIIPRSSCERYGFKSGYDILIEEQEKGLLLRPEGPGPKVNNRVWTIGYEGWKIDTFIGRLKKAGVKQLIDVREIPISRKKGFSKSALKMNLEQEGIMYKHIQELGSPSEVRGEYKAGGSVDEFMARYKDYMETQLESYDLLKGLALVTPSVIMCMEREFMICHRRIIAERLKLEGFDVKHL
jgi:uncharacterized protein (DUF488 family)